MTNHIYYWDGSCKNNPGPGGSAFVCEGLVKKLHIPLTTNNEAEYNALILALDHALEHQVAGAVFLGDSKLIVEQVNRRWKCKAANLQPLRDRACDLLSKLENPQVVWVKRDKNLADKPAKEAAENKQTTEEVSHDTLKLLRESQALLKQGVKKYRGIEAKTGSEYELKKKIELLLNDIAKLARS